MAVMKGTRQLKSLASISVFHVLLALLISVPLYFYLGESGIIPSLVLMALTLMVLTIAYSWRMFPLRLSFGKSFLHEGWGMIRLGVGFVVALLMGSLAEFVIRSFLNNNGSLEILGLYNAGYMISMTYGGMVFAAMETDYFPRISAVNDDNRSFNLLVNKQIEVSLLIVAPLFLAALNSIPHEILESAEMDGAGPVKRFFAIKLHYLSPTIFFVGIMSRINSFKIFREVYLLTGDYPYDNLYMLQHFMNNSFTHLDYSKLSAGAIVMCIVMIVIVGGLFFAESRFDKDVEE